MSKMTSTGQENMFCGFYPSSDGDRKYDNSDFGKFLDGLICDGVFLTIYDQFLVSPDEGTKITVGSGKAWFNHTWLELTKKYEIDCGPADQNADRNDAIVIAVNTTSNAVSHEGATLPARDTTIVSLTGVEEIKYGNQEISNGVYVYPIAYITRRKGIDAITSADIRITVGDDVCPFVETFLTPSNNATAFTTQWRGQLDNLINRMDVEWEGVKKTNSEDLSDYKDVKKTEIADWKKEQEASVTTWFGTIQNSLGEDAAVNLQKQITDSEVEQILKHGFVDCETTISSNGAVITSTDSEGRVLTKEFSDNFTTITTRLENASGITLGETITNISSDGSKITTTVTGSMFA